MTVLHALVDKMAAIPPTDEDAAWKAETLLVASLMSVAGHSSKEDREDIVDLLTAYMRIRQVAEGLPVMRMPEDIQ